MEQKENDEIEEKLKKPLNKKVLFTYPDGETHQVGILKERVIMAVKPNGDGVPYWDVVDLIDFGDKDEPWLRIGYYRKPKDRLVWGSQTTITEPISRWKDLLIKAGLEKEWFKNLLNAVVDEINKPKEITVSAPTVAPTSNPASA
jgi:hypothetical protein